MTKMFKGIGVVIILLFATWAVGSWIFGPSTFSGIVNAKKHTIQQKGLDQLSFDEITQLVKEDAAHAEEAVDDLIRTNIVNKREMAKLQSQNADLDKQKRLVEKRLAFVVDWVEQHPGESFRSPDTGSMIAPTIMLKDIAQKTEEINSLSMNIDGLKKQIALYDQMVATGEAKVRTYLSQVQIQKSDVMRKLAEGRIKKQIMTTMEKLDSGPVNVNLDEIESYSAVMSYVDGILLDYEVKEQRQHIKTDTGGLTYGISDQPDPSSVIENAKRALKDPPATSIDQGTAMLDAPAAHKDQVQVVGGKK